MATIRKHRDKWQAQVRLKGVRPIAKSFVKKADATAWARITESEITKGTYIDPRAAETTSFSELIDCFIQSQESAGRFNPSVKSRLKRLRGDLGVLSLNNIDRQCLAKYRDRRRQVANPATVIHELNLLKRLLKLADSELGIPLPKGVPAVSMPKMPLGRVRRLSSDEEKGLLSESLIDSQFHDLILLALETGMRRSELLNIQVSDIDALSCLLAVPKTKTGIPRVIPLTEKALSLLKNQIGEKELLFDISPSALSQRFKTICNKSGITDLRFHDLRHEAISRLFEKGLNQMEVAAISGHQTVSMLQRYTHINPEYLVAKLNNTNQGTKL